MARALPPERAATILEPAAQVLAEQLAKQTDLEDSATLAEGLAAVAKAMPPARAATVLADALAKQTYWGLRTPLAAGLSAVAKALPPEHLAANIFIDSTGQALDQIDVLIPAVLELAGHACLEQNVAWLKRPFCYGDARAAILSQIKTPDGKTFRTHWELVEWLQKNRPDIDLTSPPIDPDTARLDKPYQIVSATRWARGR